MSAARCAGLNHSALTVCVRTGLWCSCAKASSPYMNSPIYAPNPITPLTPLTLRSIEGVLVSVPMKRPLGTSAMRITHAPLLLIDITTQEGVKGCAYLFCYLPAAGKAALQLVQDVSDYLVGKSAAPHAVRRELEARFRLIGARGLVSLVMAGVDTACWDALAVSAGLPLATLLGAPLRPIPAYNSNGLGLIAPEEAADQALELVGEGFRAIKMRLGRASEQEDLAAVRAVRRVLPASTLLMADYNQALTTAQARARCHALDNEGLAWIEEPIRHDDYKGNAELCTRLQTPIQIGENFAGPRAMAHALAANACDYVMPDLERIGGVSGWITAAGIADAHAIEMSSHLFGEVSVHLLAATPTAHWLEYVDWADAVLEEPLKIVDGCAVPPNRPGHGMRWSQDAVKRLRLA